MMNLAMLFRLSSIAQRAHSLVSFHGKRVLRIMEEAIRRSVTWLSTHVGIAIRPKIFGIA